MKISTANEALDVLDDFLDEVDELYGLCSFTYGTDAYDALEFLNMKALEEFKKKIKIGR